MNITPLTTADFQRQLQEKLEKAVCDETVKVFQIIDNHHIIDRNKIMALLGQLDRQIVKHHYTVIETGKPIVTAVEENPNSIHLWYDVLESNIFHPEVMKAFLSITSGVITFPGTFVLVSSANEYEDGIYPPFPGVVIDLPNDIFVEYLETTV